MGLQSGGVNGTSNGANGSSTPSNERKEEERQRRGNEKKARALAMDNESDEALAGSLLSGAISRAVNMQDVTEQFEEAWPRALRAFVESVVDELEDETWGTVLDRVLGVS